MLKSETMLDAIKELTAEGYTLRFWREADDLLAIMITDPVNKKTTKKITCIKTADACTLHPDAPYLFALDESFKELSNGHQHKAD